MFPFSKKINKQHRTNLQELHKAEILFRSAGVLVAKNTALVHKGKDFAKQLESVANLLSQQKNGYLSAVLGSMGIQKATVNIFTGKIKLLPDVPTDNPKVTQE